MKFRNPFTRPGRWYKANLHTHTTRSDGRQSPADTAEAYRRAGYGVLALTDHNATNDVRRLSRKGFLVIGGMEYHPKCPSTPNPHHLVALNVPHGFGFGQTYPEDGNACIRAVADAGGVSILAHPLWCGHRYDMYSYLDGFIALEVYNTTTDGIGRADSEADWCHLLDAGRMLPAVAVDDSHGQHDRFGGWTWLRLGRLSVASALDALRAGCFYSSTGPRIHDFRVAGGAATVRCSPVERAYFVAHSWHGRRRKAEAGGSIRAFSAPVGSDWVYVRAVVVDHAGRKAWTNPIAL
jgi:hypothetical protein